MECPVAVWSVCWGKVMVTDMGNLIAFLNMFLSYLLLTGIIAALAAAACVIGVKLRKRKDRKDAAAGTDE